MNLWKYVHLYFNIIVMGTTQILKTYLDFKALNDTKIPVHKHGVP